MIDARNVGCGAGGVSRLRAIEIGEPYDWKAIVGFLEPDAHQHELDHVICSAFMTAALRACGYFRWPLTVPFHHISPRDLICACDKRQRAGATGMDVNLSCRAASLRGLQRE